MPATKHEAISRIRVGDRVSVEFEVDTISAEGDRVITTLKTVDQMGPATRPYNGTFVCDASIVNRRDECGK